MLAWPLVNAEAEKVWDDWYRRHGRRVISTRHWRSPRRFLESGRRDVAYLLERFQPPDRSSVLEIGCGPGRMTHALKDHFETLVANDHLQRCVDDCRQLVGGSPILLKGGSSSLDVVASNSIDFVVSVATLQHVDDEVEVLNYIRQTARVLSASGIGVLQLASSSPSRARHDRFVDRARQVISAIEGRITRRGSSPRGRHWRGNRPSDAEIARELTACGCSLRVESDALRTWLVISPLPEWAGDRILKMPDGAADIDIRERLSEHSFDP